MPRPRSIAFVGPVPPDRTGIADYNARLLTELSKRCEVTVFSPTVDLSEPTPTRIPVPVLAARALGTVVDPAAFDAVVYTLGNSEHHHESYELIQRVPGVVWLHDVRMTGLLLSYAAKLEQERRIRHVRTALERQYGAPLPAAFRDPVDWTVEAFEELDVFMAWELVRHGTATFVNSAFARDLLVSDLGPLARGIDVRVLPFAIPHCGDARTPASPDLVVAPGFVTPVKLPELVIDAFATSARCASLRLVFLGDVAPEHAVVLRERAAQWGIEERVTFTGFATAREYSEHLERACCAVLLRRTTQGESSAAVADCLAKGIPTVTNIPSTRDFDTPLLRAVAAAPTAAQLASVIDSVIAEGFDDTHSPASEFRTRHSFSRLSETLLGLLGHDTTASDTKSPV